MMFSIISDEFLFFQTIFVFLQLEQPIVVVNSHFLKMFSPFFRLFFTLPDDNSSAGPVAIEQGVMVL